MTNASPKQDVKSCCATFYQNDMVRMLLGESFHPGGLALTQHLGAVICLGERDHVLDVACGRGASAIHLAKHFGCRVTGLDFGEENVSAAEARAKADGVAHLTAFRQGDAERLPLGDGTFDAVVSECSFCTFPDKATAAAEMARVLRPGGRLGLTDMTVSGPLPADIQTLLAWVTCIAGAGRPEDHQGILQGVGFDGFAVEDRRQDLLDMTNDIRRKLLGVELAAKLGKLKLGDLDLGVGKLLARRATELIEDGVIGYELIAARKG